MSPRASLSIFPTPRIVTYPHRPPSLPTNHLKTPAGPFSLDYEYVRPKEKLKRPDGVTSDEIVGRRFRRRSHLFVSRYISLDLYKMKIFVRSSECLSGLLDSIWSASLESSLRQVKPVFHIRRSIQEAVTMDVRKYLRANEVENLLSEWRSWARADRARRSKYLWVFLTLYHTGARIREVLGLTDSAFNEKAATIKCHG